jgi:RimJ/RimL family protein N-acetyltransferase
MSQQPPRRLWMQAALDPREVRPDFAFRNPSPDDLTDLAELMLDAYRGTIDARGDETLEDAVEEMRSYFAGASGKPLLDCSFVVEDHGLPVSASLISQYEGSPLLAYSFTEPSYSGRGLATTLVQLSMNALAARRHRTLRLVVTLGNEPAQRVFEKLGFREIEQRS